MSSPRDAHEVTQAEHWSAARPDHFRWKTETPLFSESERALLDGIAARGPVLEVGCGEGSNLRHLQGAGPLHAIDRYPGKARFAAQALPGLCALVADADRLPYADGSFQTVLIRDLLHHVYDRDLVLAEAWRVLGPGGALHVIEVNGRSPLFLAQALLVSAERGILRSTPRRIRAELERLPRAEVRLSMAQPLPIERVLLHPDLGRPSLAHRRSVRGGLALFDRCCAHLLPRGMWAYIRGEARKPGD